MRAFDYVRAERVDDAVAALADRDTRCLAGGTNLLDLMKGDVEQPARLVDITRLPLARHRRRCPTAACASARCVRNSDLAQPRAGARALSAARRRRCCRARRRNCATWRPSAATCCSARAAIISPTSASPRATSASPDRAARRARATTASTRSSARASSASRRIRPTCASRWRRSTRSSRCAAARGERAGFRSREFHRLPGDTPRARHRRSRLAS